MVRTTTSMVYGLAWGAVGAAALSLILMVDPVFGGYVGGMVGYMAGSKFGKIVYDAAKKLLLQQKKQYLKFGRVLNH